MACSATAFGGFVAVTEFGTGPLAVAAALVWGVLALRIFRIHMPPALAVGLIPFVMDEPDRTLPALGRRRDAAADDRLPALPARHVARRRPERVNHQ